MKDTRQVFPGQRGYRKSGTLWVGKSEHKAALRSMQVQVYMQFYMQEKTTMCMRENLTKLPALLVCGCVRNSKQQSTANDTGKHMTLEETSHSQQSHRIKRGPSPQT